MLDKQFFFTQSYHLCKPVWWIYQQRLQHHQCHRSIFFEERLLAANNLQEQEQRTIRMTLKNVLIVSKYLEKIINNLIMLCVDEKMQINWKRDTNLVHRWCTYHRGVSQTLLGECIYKSHTWWSAYCAECGIYVPIDHTLHKTTLRANIPCNGWWLRSRDSGCASSGQCSQLTTSCECFVASPVANIVGPLSVFDTNWTKMAAEQNLAHQYSLNPVEGPQASAY